MVYPPRYPNRSVSWEAEECEWIPGIECSVSYGYILVVEDNGYSHLNDSQFNVFLIILCSYKTKEAQWLMRLPDEILTHSLT